MAVGYEWQATYIRNILQCHAVRACPVRTILNGCRHRRWKITIKYHTNDSDGILTVMWNMIIEEGVWGVMVRQFYANRDGNFSLYIIILQNRKKKTLSANRTLHGVRLSKVAARRNIDYWIFSRVWSISYASVFDGITNKYLDMTFRQFFVCRERLIWDMTSLT